MSYKLPTSEHGTSDGQLTIDIRPLLEDVSQVMTKHISSILSGVVGEYTVYKETHEDVIAALDRTQYNLKQVIREYMTSGSGSGAASTTAAAAAVSTNQMRFSEIRNFMDKSAETFRRNQEMTRIYQQVQEKKKQQAAEQAAEAAAQASVAAQVAKL